MARKGNQQKNGLDHGPQNRKTIITDARASPLPTKDGGNVNEEEVGLGKELPNGNRSMPTKSSNDIDHFQDVKNTKKKSKKPQRKERKGVDETITGHAVPCSNGTEVDMSGTSTPEASNVRVGSDISNVQDFDNIDCFHNSSNSMHIEEGLGNVEFPETTVFRFIRTATLSVARSSANWLERHTHTFGNLKSDILKARDYVQIKIQVAHPIVFRWIKYIGNIMLLLFMVWLDCTIRGIDSFLRMGTTSFFSILWCSVLSVTAMAGIGKVLLTLAVAAAVGLFLGFTLAVVLTGVAGIAFLWIYGSFWTTGLIIFLGGLAFMTTHDRIALFITSVYSIYCAWNYVGWLGLLLGLNLSFISSDALLFFLRNIVNEQGIPHSSPEQAAGSQGQPSYAHESIHSPTENGSYADRNSGMASTSGSDSETTSEDEVARLLKCADHYAAFGLSRFENIDLAVIKKEYRKKAMLVHPDKNMGNEKAAEAFKKLQNAYEVLLDSFKRKEYDDELRREELLNYFRKIQNSSHQNKGHGLFKSRFTHPEANAEDPLGESRHIACRKCGFFHLWVYTNKLKSRARWCQECKDFHVAKDGDGWVEQSSQPFFFGMLQHVEAPSAYVCAGGKVYDATEWYICQGMRCPANTHKPSFQVNTSVVSKNAHTKTSTSAQRGGQPPPNMEETMTEEEFFEWLQNAVQSGIFENSAGSTSESSSGANPKSGGNNNGSANSKRKKKGKKQW